MQEMAHITHVLYSGVQEKAKQRQWPLNPSLLLHKIKTERKKKPEKSFIPKWRAIHK